MLLSLPVLSASIPGLHRTGTLGAMELKMVLSMSRLGLLTENDTASITTKVSMYCASVTASEKRGGT